MSISPQEFRDTANAVLAILASAAADLDDDALTGAQRLVAAHRRSLDACAAVLGGEIGRRSRFELGYSGLAQRSGFRTPEALVQSLTGATRAEAVALVQVGAIMAETDAAADAVDAAEAVRNDPSASVEVSVEVPVPWQAGVAEAISARTLSVAAADATRVGLGEVSENVTADILATAAATLVAAAGEHRQDERRQDEHGPAAQAPAAQGPAAQRPAAQRPTDHRATENGQDEHRSDEPGSQTTDPGAVCANRNYTSES